MFCKWKIRTLITVYSASFYLLLQEFDITELLQQLTHWSLKYQVVERPNLPGVSCRPRFEYRMTFHTLCLIPERWIGSRAQSTSFFPELCCIPFSVAQVLVELRNQLINNFVFPTAPMQLGLIIIIIECQNQ